MPAIVPGARPGNPGGVPSDLRETHILGPNTYQRLVDADRFPAMRGMGIREAGLSLCDRRFGAIVDRPACAQAMFVLDRAGSVLVGGGWHEVSAGHLYVCPPGLRRGCRAAEQGFHIGWITWEPGPVPGIPEVPALTRRPCDALAETIRLLWRELAGSADALALAHLAPLLQLQAGRLLETGPRLDQLWQAVDADPGHPWSVDRLAAMLGVGGEQLRRLCLAQHAQRPMERVRGLRLARAAALLRSTGMPVAQVAAAVGYRDAEAFSTAFRHHHGTSPQLFRRSAGGGV